MPLLTVEDVLKCFQLRTFAPSNNNNLVQEEESQGWPKTMHHLASNVLSSGLTLILPIHFGIIPLHHFMTLILYKKQDLISLRFHQGQDGTLVHPWLQKWRHPLIQLPLQFSPSPCLHLDSLRRTNTTLPSLFQVRCFSLAQNLDCFLVDFQVSSPPELLVRRACCSMEHVPAKPS